MDEARVVKLVQEAIGSPIGQCYPASEAVYHLLGGKTSGYTPMRVGGEHWWLRRPDGTVLDATAAQYTNGFDYSTGKAGGFLTRKPSKRGQAVIDKVRERVRNDINRDLKIFYQSTS
jgi:ribosomal protein L34